MIVWPGIRREKTFSRHVNKPLKAARQIDIKTDSQTENKEKLNVVNF